MVLWLVSLGVELLHLLPEGFVFRESHQPQIGGEREHAVLRDFAIGSRSNLVGGLLEREMVVGDHGLDLGLERQSHGVVCRVPNATD
ncbi:hypothetical protein PHBOTO_003889 [Pseudozyma hubeiensis]|nr:hypothetical protein PHBOTO_003889 [Pseudozyma hubeiensis]